MHANDFTCKTISCRTIYHYLSKNRRCIIIWLRLETMEDKNQHGGYLLKSTYDAFLLEDQHYRDALAKNSGEEYAKTHYDGVEQTRRRTREKFPHTQVTRAFYPENDLAVKWCWSHFGPQDT